MTTGRPADPLATIQRLRGARPEPQSGERCDMCAAPVADDHSHVVDLENRGLLCTCRPCYLLFTDERAHLHYRAVPDRYLTFGPSALDARAWDELRIPVGLAFLFRNSVQERTVAFYPGPAGATESELPLEAWPRIVERDPALAVLRPDVEALIIRRGDEPGATDISCYLVPIDACYELVGRLRLLWRGFDGGQEARAAVRDFFAAVEARSRPARAEVAP